MEYLRGRQFKPLQTRVRWRGKLTGADGTPLPENAAARPCIVRAGELFWLPMTVPFTGTIGEQAQAFTKTVDFDLLIRGVWTDLTRARIRLVQSDSDLNYSLVPVPIQSLAGRSDKTQPIRWLRHAIPLRALSTLRADFINDNGESAGNVVFIGERIGREREIPVRCSTEFRLLMDLAAPVTQPVDYDVLIWGAYTDAPSNVSVRIFDESNNYAWSGELLPIGAFAGQRDETQPIVYYPRPYLLPRRVKLRADTSTGASGYLVFLCERILQ